MPSPRPRESSGPAGRLIVATEDPASFDDVWFARYFPSVPELERSRFPSEAALRGELVDAGFEDVRVEQLSAGEDDLP